jgi:hypothetical protein
MDQTAALRLFTIVVAIIALPVTSAFAQQFHAKRASGPPVENKPKVDEKAYKAALDRIPLPEKQYDPWGIVHPPQSGGAAKKSN